ncbi:MAG: DUF433 domain-containing protein [Luteitalea sp.]|nr:DUF433 domain-containing protein [Luteitalea sp.]
MSATETIQPVPIHTDPHGVIRVGGTRVTLDTLVAAFHAGATPEEIVQQYPSVTLADAYSVIAYYLRHQAEIRAYITVRQQQAAQVREGNERRFDASGIRDRLLARRR